jgi:hypothetical protein
MTADITEAYVLGNASSSDEWRDLYRGWVIGNRLWGIRFGKRSLETDSRPQDAQKALRHHFI